MEGGEWGDITPIKKVTWVLVVPFGAKKAVLVSLGVFSLVLTLRILSRENMTGGNGTSRLDFRRSLGSSLRSSPRREFGEEARAPFPNSGW